MISVIVLAPLACSVSNHRDPTAEVQARLASLRPQLNPNERNESERERLTRVEESIAACMARNGFDYEVVSPERLLIRLDDDSTEFGSMEWAGRYGLGISTIAFSQAQVGPELVGYIQKRSPVDPNQSHIASLSPEEQLAYVTTLFGTPPTPTVDGDGTMEIVGTGGCSGEASEHSMADAAEEKQRFIDAFGEAVDELEARFANHPKTIAHRRAAMVCMADHGYPDESIGDLRSRLEASTNELQIQAIVADATATARTSDSPALVPEEEAELSLDLLQQLAALQREEIQSALAAHDCGFSEAAEDQTIGELRASLERAWIDEHRNELIDYLDPGGG